MISTKYIFQIENIFSQIVNSSLLQSFHQRSILVDRISPRNRDLVMDQILSIQMMKYFQIYFLFILYINFSNKYEYMKRQKYKSNQRFIFLFFIDKGLASYLFQTLLIFLLFFYIISLPTLMKSCNILPGYRNKRKGQFTSRNQQLFKFEL